jgi:hypothetical protein
MAKRIQVTKGEGELEYMTHWLMAERLEMDRVRA